MSGAYDGKAANEWRRAQRHDDRAMRYAQEQAAAANRMGSDDLYNMRARTAYEDWKRQQERPSLAKAHTKPSGLGVQIDAMINRLIEDGHSKTNIARVMRLRADKMEAAE